MLLIVLVCSLALAASGQQVDNDWIDPYDMLNYDATTKTMRKPAEPANRRGEEPCGSKVEELQKQVGELKKTITVISQKPTCNPVFKRFLSRLLKKIQGVGLPSDDMDILCDAKIQLSKQGMAEIQRLLEGEDSGGTGALDDAISKILVDLKPHNYELWIWRFEDTFGVEIDTLLKMGLFVLVIMAIICTQLWSGVSWFMQVNRLLAVCFFVSIIWNWFYLYKIAFAEHQNNMAKLDGVNEKCTGVKKIDWSDSLKEWFRSTWTLQDDPCKKYYEVLMVNPILLVPPTKAIAVTITTFITEPLKHFGQGISEFLRALLKDLPVTLQIPVLITIVLSFVVCIYGSVQAAFRHGITAPFRRPQRDPPPPPLEQPQRRIPRIEDLDHLAGGDAGWDAGSDAGRDAQRHALQHAPRHRADDDRLHINQPYQRRPHRAKVVTVRAAERPYSEDELDALQGEEEQNLSAESDSENQPETQEELAGASASSVAANTAQSKTKPTESDPSQAKTKPTKPDPSQAKTKPTKPDPSQAKTKPTKPEPSQPNTNSTESEPPPPSEDELSGDRVASLSTLINFQDLQPSAEDQPSSIKVSIQESSPGLAAQTVSTVQED